MVVGMKLPTADWMIIYLVYGVLALLVAKLVVELVIIFFSPKK